MQGVKLVSTPAMNSSGSAVAGLPEKRWARCVKSTGGNYTRCAPYHAHAAVMGHSSQRGTVYLQVSFPCSRSSSGAAASAAAFVGSSAEAASRDDRYVFV